jgi:hypothetical protein
MPTELSRVPRSFMDSKMRKAAVAVSGFDADHDDAVEEPVDEGSVLLGVEQLG